MFTSSAFGGTFVIALEMRALNYSPLHGFQLDFIVDCSISDAPRRKLMHPWVHFVPVRADLSDLRRRILWCRDNDDGAQKLAETLFELAMHHLTRDCMEDTFAQILVSLPPPAEEALARSALEEIWLYKRSAIYCLLDDEGHVRSFVPFANAEFKNDWSGSLRFDPPSLSTFLETAAHRFGYEPVLSDTESWWDNGSLSCRLKR